MKSVIVPSVQSPPSMLKLHDFCNRALYRTSTVIVNSMAQQLLGHGLRSAVVAGGTFAGGRAVAALAGPVGWVIAGVWTAVDLAGPAYRVTIPCVLHIAMLRLKARAEAATDFMNGAFDG
ncbi:ubiquinol-cytochrome C chaperone family protein [Pseudomonas aeruginosa]|uniref:ubiquinol-cytochrome C chaperone family protein n=1 Tax=Pseudomonas aeruginosa TaxID=287 RepID=UPI001E353B92|nr:ubiquinol-cytochrome C chaperone family protein [Pseudomonas aeruginosa]